MVVILHPVKPILGLWAVPLLPEPPHIELRYSIEVVLWRVLFFVIEERCIIVCVVIYVGVTC